MASAHEIRNKGIGALVSDDANGLLLTASQDPVLLDKLVDALRDLRRTAAENAKARFHLIKSFWPNFETSGIKNPYVSWIARDTERNRDVELVYEFDKREYAIRDQDEILEQGEIKTAIAMIYVILPESEVKMVSIMQDRYETMTASADIKRVSHRRR
jgi:hypothetical protein